MPGLLTPPVISKLPLGLLGLFQIKNGGQYPQSLVPSIQPQMEMLSLLAANHADELVNSGTIAGAGTTGILLVPNGEVWFVPYASLYVVTQAAEAWDGALTIAIPAVSSVPKAFFPIGGRQTIAASLTSPSMARDFWLPPLGEIFVQTFSTTGTVDYQISASILRFPF